MDSAALIHYPHITLSSRIVNHRSPARYSMFYKSLRPKPVSLYELRSPLLCGGSGVGLGGNGAYSLGLIGFFLNGWRSRVAADPDFPFKVLMEVLLGVLGQMATRPNFGLNELDFVFSTLAAGSTLKFILMYALTHTLSASTAGLPSISTNCPMHMFEPGPYTLANRPGKQVNKGTLFVAELMGTAISNWLVKTLKKRYPTIEPPIKAPPTLVYTMTWAIHMGVSSYLWYQTLNGIESLIAKSLPPYVVINFVIGLRIANYVFGGMTFMILARLTGLESYATEKKEEKVDSLLDEEDLVQVK